MGCPQEIGTTPPVGEPHDSTRRRVAAGHVFEDNEACPALDPKIAVVASAHSIVEEAAARFPGGDQEMGRTLG